MLLIIIILLLNLWKNKFLLLKAQIFCFVCIHLFNLKHNTSKSIRNIDFKLKENPYTMCNFLFRSTFKKRARHVCNTRFDITLFMATKTIFWSQRCCVWHTVISCEYIRSPVLDEDTSNKSWNWTNSSHLATTGHKSALTRLAWFNSWTICKSYNNNNVFNICLVWYKQTHYFSW